MIAPMAQALDVFHCPLDGVRLIEASAGTGKTWNICGLYLRLLLDRDRPLKVDQILVVTFTKAATAELRGRTRQRIVDVLSHLEQRGPTEDDPFVTQLLESLHAEGQEDDHLKRLLTQALRSFDEASIFTIHGFCQRALDDTPFTAGLPLRQDLIEDDGELRSQAANDFWRRNVAGATLQPGLAHWLLQGRDSPEKFARLLQRHCGKPLSPVIWPDVPEAADMPEAAKLAFSELEAAYHALRALWAKERSAVVACVLASLPSLHKTYYKAESVVAAAAEWDAAFAAGQPMGCLALDTKASLLRSSRFKPLTGRAPCQEHAFFAAAEALLTQWEAFTGALAAARMALLRRLVEEGPGLLRQLKRQRRVLAFDDLLFNLHHKLEEDSEGKLAAALRARFPAALIDEFQDTDPLQFAIFDAVYGGAADAALFLVGDPKQAIYSFRNADLQTYLGARAKAQAEYTLSENQRSSPELIGALNALFGQNPRAFMLAGLEYRKAELGTKPRKPFVDQTQPRAALQLWNLHGPKEGQARMKDDAVAASARACAAEIARLLAAGQEGLVTHDGKGLAAAEIAVLVRSHSEGSRMRAALGALGVGSVELAQTSVFESQDAEELEHLLRAVLEPGRQGLVRAALATELLGLCAADLAALSTDEAAMLMRTQRFSDYRATWQARGIGPMLRDLIAMEGINARMLLRSDGERRLTNVRHLAECLHEASAEHPAPEALLRWLQRQRQDAVAGEAAQVRLESDRNLVQIVTIHKSKGLEYPVVFCPFLWNGHAGGGRKDLMGCEYHDDDGRPVIDYRELATEDPLRKRIRAERDAERLRLIYVALTRAVHRCYLVVGSYRSRVGSSKASKECTGNPLNWLVAGTDCEPTEWRDMVITGEDVVHAWERLATEHGSVMALDPLPDTTGVALQPPALDPASLTARALPRPIPAGWRRGSYTGLMHGARHESTAVDHDVRAARRDIASAARLTLAADDILRFPSGAREGSCLHAAFEHAHFADSSTWRPAVDAALRRHPPGNADADAAVLAPMVLRMLGEVYATPLPGGFSLSELRPGRQVAELEFNLRAPRLDVSRLSALLRRHGYASKELSRQVLQGYLHGFIDLVFEHQGGFHILDWKSNHLGYRPQDYSQKALKEAMDGHGYHLQYLLYTIAVHRWLQRRLAGYQYEQHFAGVQYLFVRGVRPAWKDEDGSALGVFSHKPSLAVVSELEALFGQAGEQQA